MRRAFPARAAWWWAVVGGIALAAGPASGAILIAPVERRPVALPEPAAPAAPLHVSHAATAPVLVVPVAVGFADAPTDDPTPYRVPAPPAVLLAVVGGLLVVLSRWRRATDDEDPGPLLPA